ncbi:hypothetical protein GCM10008932_10270 [Alkalibacterium iburiense]|uniref:Cardiolipin synthase N-terminal domain-containing protein n=1 Tax=Alkalibacterium iburiense TaxID=290589 RepID=A0ABP3H0V3_9LACT
MASEIMNFLPIILPLLVLQLILLVVAIVHLVKNDRLDQTHKLIWALVIVFVNIIGPILYLIFGRKDD